MDSLVNRSIRYLFFCLVYFLLPSSSLLANILYIGNNTELSVADTSTNHIALSLPLVAPPVLIAITPNNLFAYVTVSNNSIDVIDTATNRLFTTINLPSGSNPVGIAITPNGQFVYVADIGSGTVSVISTAINQVVDTIFSFAEPWGIAITPDGLFAYVVNLNGGVSPGYVSVIDLATNTVLSPTIEVGNGPTGIAITPGGLAYVTNENSNTVSLISTKTHTLIATIPVGINPFEVAANPNGQFVYVSNNSYTSPSNGSISVIWTLTNQVVETIALGNKDPAGLAVTPDGQTLYVTNTVDVTVISTAKNQVIAAIPISQSSSIAITGTLISNLTGKQKTNDFGLLYEYYNHLEWQPVPYSDVLGYHIYRNGTFIASVNSNTLQYDDHNQKKKSSTLYWVAPVEASGNESTPLSVVVK